MILPAFDWPLIVTRAVAPSEPRTRTGIDYSVLGDCDWRGPQAQRCLLWNDHPLMTVGYLGHLPDRSVPADKPPPVPDAQGIIGAH